MRKFVALATWLLIVSTFGAFTTSQTTVKVLPNPDSSNYKDFTGITKGNVKDLQMAWYYPYGAERFSPIFANGVLYVMTERTLFAIQKK